MERLLNPSDKRGARRNDLAGDLGWIQRQAHALFVEDDRGRLRSTRETQPAPAPRFWLGRTRLGNVWRFRFDLEAETLRRLARYAAREAALAADWASSAGTPLRVPPPPERWDAIRRALEAQAPIERAWRGPAFRFPEVSPAPRAAGPARGPRVRLATPEDSGRLASSPGFEWLARELGDCEPCIVALEDGRVVGACWSSRNDPDTAEAGVETRGESRERGVARATVSAWARAVRAQGREPLYSTSWENPASLGVARSLGLVAYGEDLHLT